MQVSHQTLIDHFQRYKSTDVVYVSGDQLFLTRAAALSYGNGDMRLPLANNDFPDTLTAEQVEAMTYEQLKAASAALNLTTEDNKKTTIKQALLAFINQ